MRLLGLAILSLLVSCAPAMAVRPEQVDASLASAKQFLYSTQAVDGTWEVVPAPDPKASDQSVADGQYTGLTAIAAYALLAAGEKPNDPKLTRAIEFLKKTPTQGTYALGIRCQVWLALPQTPDVKQAMERDGRLLITGGKQKAANSQGMYDYLVSANSPVGSYSHSRSQYAVLGVWAAEQAGMKVPDSYWQMTERAWVRNQDRSGGWNYTHQSDNRNDFPITPGMTAVGVATLFITQDYLLGKAAAECRGNIRNEPIERGMAWMATNMDKVATNQKVERDIPYATLYAVERIGVAAGVRYIGGVDWFDKGADWLIKQQRKDGGWSGGGTDVGGTRTPTTAFAMLFLARGRAPVVVSKLDFSPDSAKPVAWNQRPRDVANLTRWIGRTIEQEVNWQSVTLEASLEDLIQTPVLYLAGSEAPLLKPEQVDKLRAYVEAGGLIFANADCGKGGFTAGIRKLGETMFPAYRFRELPGDSPVYGTFARDSWKTKPAVLALGNGVREFIILVPAADPARSWQLREHESRRDAFELGANVLLYACPKDRLKPRGSTHYVVPASDLRPTLAVTVARLKHGGNWDPEPGGWKRLAARFANVQKTDLKTVVIDLSERPDFGDAKFAHLTGTGPLKLSPEAVQSLRAYVNGGGTLLVDSAGGDVTFAGDAAAIVDQLLPGAAMEPMKLSDPAFAQANLQQLSYRPFALTKGVGLEGTQRLKSVQVAGRSGVIYSAEDLSAGLVGSDTSGILGYTPESATAVVEALIRHYAR